MTRDRPRAVERILIVNLTRFGDLLQTSPAIAALRRRHPDAHLTLIIDLEEPRHIAEGAPVVASDVRVEGIINPG